MIFPLSIKINSVLLPVFVLVEADNFQSFYKNSVVPQL